MVEGFPAFAGWRVGVEMGSSACVCWVTWAGQLTSLVSADSSVEWGEGRPHRGREPGVWVYATPRLLSPETASNLLTITQLVRSKHRLSPSCHKPSAFTL